MENLVTVLDYANLSKDRKESFLNNISDYTTVFNWWAKTLLDYQLKLSIIKNEANVVTLADAELQMEKIKDLDFDLDNANLNGVKWRYFKQRTITITVYVSIKQFNILQRYNGKKLNHENNKAAFNIKHTDQEKGRVKAELTIKILSNIK